MHMKTISIIKEEHKGNFKVKIYFNDNTSRIIDFENFFSKHSHPQYDQYKKLSLFKRFKIVMGNIVWGKDWDLVFPTYDLYRGKI